MTRPTKVTKENIDQTKVWLGSQFGVDVTDIHVTSQERTRMVPYEDGLGERRESYYHELSFEVRIPLAGLQAERAAAKAAQEVAEKKAAEHAARTATNASPASSEAPPTGA